jgi:hypothetical protein
MQGQYFVNYGISQIFVKIIRVSGLFLHFTIPVWIGNCKNDPVYYNEKRHKPPKPQYIKG